MAEQRGAGRRGRRLIVPCLVVLLAACGKTGPPVAPEVRVPSPPVELRATVRAQEVSIEWKNPDHRVDGTRMRDLAKVRLYRREDTGDAPPRPAMRVGSTVNGFADVAAFDITGDRRANRYVDRDVAIGHRYTYVLTAADSKGRISAPSPRLFVVMIAAPQPPSGLVTREGEAEATLAWEPPGQLIDGSPMAGVITYDVFRSTAADVAPAEVRATALETPRFTDTKLENERTYFYAVRAVRTESVGAASSEPTAPVPVTPRDMTPPSPPTDLVAIPSPATVRLAWRASPEPDVAAYVVYRAEGDDAPVRVGRVEVPRTAFIDRDVPPGTYRYFVTAVDRASRANESRRSAETTVTVP